MRPPSESSDKIVLAEILQAIKNINLAAVKTAASKKITKDTKPSDYPRGIIKFFEFFEEKFELLIPMIEAPGADGTFSFLVSRLGEEWLTTEVMDNLDELGVLASYISSSCLWNSIQYDLCWISSGGFFQPLFSLFDDFQPEKGKLYLQEDGNDCLKFTIMTLSGKSAMGKILKKDLWGDPPKSLNADTLNQYRLNIFSRLIKAGYVSDKNLCGSAGARLGTFSGVCNSLVMRRKQQQEIIVPALVLPSFDQNNFYSSRVLNKLIKAKENNVHDDIINFVRYVSENSTFLQEDLLIYGALLLVKESIEEKESQFFRVVDELTQTPKGDDTEAKAALGEFWDNAINDLQRPEIKHWDIDKVMSSIPLFSAFTF